MKKRLFVILLCFVLMAIPLFPVCAADQKAEKTVRVGWYESSFNKMDENERRSGYAYDYQRKIAAYTGWNYEYVEGSWPDLLEKLIKGEIDLLSDVTYTEERAEQMLFSSYSMGTEEYYLYIAPGNKEIRMEDPSSVNGKKIGVNKNSIQSDLFRKWEEDNHINADLTEMTCTEEESQRMVTDGELDAFISLDLYNGEQKLIPVFKVGSSDYCFAVNKERSDLLTELNAAMSRIQSENRFYNEHLFEKYNNESVSNRYLSADEKDWLADHGTIRVAYQDNYMAFCAKDPETGELTGALKDFLDASSVCLENAQIKFEAISYPTSSQAMEALNNKEADCVFPANLTDYDSEMMGLIVTPSMMRSEMDAVVCASDQKEFLHKEDVTVAVNEGNTNYDLFLEEHFPNWKTIYFKDTPECLNAVAAGEADCILISTYRFNNISKQCNKLHLTTVSTGVEMDYGFAVRSGEKNLYSILTKVTATVPDSTVNAALTYYSTEDVKISFVDIIIENIYIILIVFTVILSVIIILLVRSNRAQRKIIEGRRMVDDLNKRVYVDALTSVRNKGAFNEYIGQIQEQIDSGALREVAIGALDCNDLKTINDRFGHDKGDEYLKTACGLICRVFKHSPVFRIGGDEFAVVLQNDDYKNKDALVERFKKEEKEICATAQYDWDYVSVAIGIAEYDPQLDKSIKGTLRRADEYMYEKKRIEKQNKKDDQKR